MTEIRLHNSLTRTKETFAPIREGAVGMYVCGPTVYDLAHLGNARSAVVFDQVRRTLAAKFPRMTYVRNVTDIDDKIIERAALTGEPIGALTARNHAAYLSDMAELGVLPPDAEPEATGHIPEMLAMVATLVANGHAYVSEGHVLFDVASNPMPNVLSGHAAEDLRSGASERVAHAAYKRDQADFILWKPSALEQPGWESPWGRGRPGWHIECSAMAAKYLGPVFDIHGGGHDLAFPHHENEIAQSSCAHGTARMANWFMHNGMLTVGGKKMSKSLGNFVTVRDLLGANPGDGEAIRLVLLSAHYRQSLDFTPAKIGEASRTLARFGGIIARAGLLGASATGSDAPVMAALADDINTPLAIARLHALASEAAVSDSPATAADLLASGRLLGLFGREPGTDTHRGEADPGVERLVVERDRARKNRDFRAADAARDRLSGMGVVLEDGPSGTTWRRVRSEGER